MNIDQYLDFVTEAKMDFDFSRSQKIASLLKESHPLHDCIIIGGTNGKGSTLAFLQSILQAHDFSVGTFTSPHILDVTERIQINQTPITKGDFDHIGHQFLDLCKKHNVQCTYLSKCRGTRYI